MFLIGSSISYFIAIILVSLFFYNTDSIVWLRYHSSKILWCCM